MTTAPEQSRPPLPRPRRSGAPYRIGMVCLGNICRSPVAEVVLRRMLDQHGLGDRVVVDSGGTGDWHLGQPMDRGAADSLRGGGYDGSAHRARQVDAGWLAEHDLLLAMDEENLTDLQRLFAGQQLDGRLLLFRSFDPQARPNDRDVPDPYGGGRQRFAAVLDIVERSAAELVDRLAEVLPRGGR